MRGGVTTAAVVLGAVLGGAAPHPAATQALEPAEVTFPTLDGGTVVAHRYGQGGRSVVLAHGAVFDKESWAPLARALAEAGLDVLAIDLRGYGRSTPGTEQRALHLDVLGAVKYLRALGSTEVAVVGASMGGFAAGLAATLPQVAVIDRLVLLAASPIPNPEAISGGSVLFVVSQGDGVARRVREQFAAAAEPKQLEVLPGDAHAQHIFRTGQADRLTKLLVEFLAAPDSP